MNTATIIVTDRIEGVWDRSVVAGVSVLEIVIVHFITQFLIIVVQSMEVLIITFGIMKADYTGSLITVTVLIMLQGACGISTGKYSRRNANKPSCRLKSEALWLGFDLNFSRVLHFGCQHKPQHGKRSLLWSLLSHGDT